MDTRNRFRKIHLDFHTSPLIPDIGKRFDADRFADTLARAHVNYVVCFAKCHHGMCYYPARHGTRHPHLSFDLLGAQIEACHRRDIAVSAYLSVVWEEEAARLHPEWQQLGPDDMPRHKTPGDRWATVCLNSPYVKEMLLPQVEEVVRGYDVDGMWFDMIHLDDNACYCRWCRDRMKQMGLSYDSPADCFRHTAASVYEFLGTCSSIIRRFKPRVDIEYNSQVRIGARGALPHITGFEVECTPSERGYSYFAFFARSVRTLGLPVRGVTPRFHRIWADFGSIKNTAQLRWETATMLAAGAACSIGDQMHPEGELDAPVYDRIRAAYAAVRDCEPWCAGAVPRAEIGLLADTDITDFGIAKASDAEWGAGRMLLELQAQFDVLDEASDFSRYRLLVLPENRHIGADLARRLQEFAQKGGALFAAHPAGFGAALSACQVPAFGITYRQESECSVNYIEPAASFGEHLPVFPFVVRRPFACAEAAPGTAVLARMLTPYFERTAEHFTSHHHAPVHAVSPFPALTRNGQAIFSAAPIFSAYHRDGDTHLKAIFAHCLDLLLPDPLLRVTPRNPMLEASILRQGARHIVHLVNYAANKRGQCPETIEHIPSLHDVNLAVRAGRLSRVYLAPQMQDIPFEVASGYVRCRVPRVDIAQLVVLET